ncbi:hypothetical protein ABGB12_33295 [Actinocorallia sp. B10E7]|uniref:hypothetical protein n=1 Tax=Actinocorallia sp. B10E7 TaxID=3153558 RepID=UPI00325D7829
MTSTLQLPPVAPDVTAAAVENLTSRLRKKLDAAVEQYAAAPATAGDDGSVTVVCGEETSVVLTPGPSGTITSPEQAVCSCLLAPRCLHRAAVLTACPIADPAESGEPDSIDEASVDAVSVQDDGSSEAGTDKAASAEAGKSSAAAGPVSAANTGIAAPESEEKLKPAQIRAAEGLRQAAAAVLAVGAHAVGAVPQAELLRAAHTARLAGLHRAEAAALRVVRGVRSARARHDGHRLADLTGAMRELLLATSLLASGRGGAALVGTARRDYRQGTSLRVQGVFREPVISATGYGGVVTHLVAEDGSWFSVADVKPGGPSRARAAATAPVAMGGTVLDHAELSRSGLLIAGVTISPDGRLGAGKGVRALPSPGLDWQETPAVLFGRPLAEVVADRLTLVPGADPVEAEAHLRRPFGCDLVIIGPSGDHVLAYEPTPDDEPTGPPIRLTPAQRHPDLAHVANLRQLAARPGLRVRVVARVDPDRATTLIPLAAAPVPGAALTLRLPAEWKGHADLGYDSLQGAHFPPAAEFPPPHPLGPSSDPLVDSPLWRVRRLVELAVSGGRRAIAESARDNGSAPALLRRAGFRNAADLTTALTAEADRRTRDVFGRLTDTDSRDFAAAWLASSLHLTATERALIRATWQPPASD